MKIENGYNQVRIVFKNFACIYYEGSKFYKAYKKFQRMCSKLQSR